MTPDHPRDPAAETVAALGERRLVARIRALVPPAPAWVRVGIGDDGAVIEPARNTLDVVTTDSLVEGVHVDRRYMDAGDIGHKLLAATLSDLASMGAAPRAAVLSLVLPPTLPVSDVDALVGAVVDLASAHAMALVGGNIARSPGPLCAELTGIGSVRRRKVLTRAGARPGDALYVSGTVGTASAGLAWLQSRIGAADSASTAGEPERPLARATGRFLRPEPRVRLGTLLGRTRAATACIDLSDGLAAAVHELAAASGAGITLEAEALPLDPEARGWFASQGQDPVDAALAGGEDYELAFTVSPRHRGRLRHVRHLIGRLPLTRIGRVTAERDIVIVGPAGRRPLPDGFQHF